MLVRSRSAPAQEGRNRAIRRRHTDRGRISSRLEPRNIRLAEPVRRSSATGKTPPQFSP